MVGQPAKTMKTDEKNDNSTQVFLNVRVLWYTSITQLSNDAHDLLIGKPKIVNGEIRTIEHSFSDILQFWNCV